jgi:plasmid stability protein
VASLLIRNLEEDVKNKLRLRAARNNRSMESEAREILTTAVAAPPPENGLGTRIRELFSDVDPEALAEWQHNLELVRRWSRGDSQATKQLFAPHPGEVDR